ncbi:Rho GTPase activation protein [Wolfiporia cocos MD-104 SS10]|uniref:Rho GTPase activation protein n=1 Tax=Wolfiporia cocos (strain MD-104) TaxID=742152 RepID=A0A2H3J1I1_WOLCO|nr:Rho GTPase activation protein [Wolfiporia cocos MD-104 SS10]
MPFTKERPAHGPRRTSLPVTTGQEFNVAVDVCVSAKATATLRKPAVLYRKSHDKFDIIGDSSRNVRGSDSAPKKVKEKASWLSLGRGAATNGLWKSAICKFVEEEEACALNIYIDDTTPYRSVYIYLLYQTDIRPVHHSLFDRKDCLDLSVTHNFPLHRGQMWAPTPIGQTEPIFLHFPDTETMSLWLALLRSHAIPEVYGRWLAPSDGGLYRMWRQVELTCLQGRNLGAPRPMSPSAAAPSSDDGHLASAGDAGDAETIATEIDVYCEIFVNGVVCGRTTVKRGIGAPDWQERFAFADLPPFENLEIVVWREKRMARPVMVGTVLIVLANFRRGEFVEGWFPVISAGGSSVGAGVQAGEMRLRIRVDEEIILPHSEYAGVLETFSSRNSLDLMLDLESKLKLKSISNHIISIAIAENVLVDHIMELADREVDAHNTLLSRGNTVLTKTMELFMSWYGAAFLEASVGLSIRRLCSDKVAIEVDPVRSGKGARSTEKSVELLVYWCQEFWTCIYEARKQCPLEMRRLFEHIRSLVEKRYQSDDARNRELPWQSVSAFCFLRFIVPAILHPHLFGLWPGLPDARVQRSLTLIAKVIQNLANLNPSVQKEEFMRGVKDFLINSLPAMIDYIIVVSTPELPDTEPPPPATDPRERSRILEALRQRGAASSVLHRESTPSQPHLTDLPKHLAVVTSVVVRYSRANNYLPVPPASAQPTDPNRQFDVFCARCLEVEEQALYRVSQLATRPRRHSSGRPAIPSPLAASVPLPPSPSSPIKIPRRDRKTSSARSSRPARRLVRPSTAPHSADTNHSAEGSSEASMPMSPASEPLSPVVPLSHSAPDASQSDGHIRERTRSLRRPRFPFAQHQPRSSSTDSALMSQSLAEKLSIVASRTQDGLQDFSDDRRRKGILRNILTRR